MAVERILITVKTYPTLSASYGELVCTAGLLEDGTWIRIYPIPFRRLEEYQKFEKFRFITANVIRNTKDSRPESYKVDFDSIQLTETILSTRDSWRERREWVLSRSTVYDDLGELIAAANTENSLSLATFKPTNILDFVVARENPDWDPQKLASIESQSHQGELFPEWKPQTLTRLVKKLPWKFSYLIEDARGRKSRMMIEDWEIGALYWKCLKRSATEKEAVEKVKRKYLEDFGSRDLHLFLGTTREWHGRGLNPFVIIGVFYPPFQDQAELDLFT